MDPNEFFTVGTMTILFWLLNTVYCLLRILEFNFNDSFFFLVKITTLLHQSSTRLLYMIVWVSNLHKNKIRKLLSIISDNKKSEEEKKVTQYAINDESHQFLNFNFFNSGYFYFIYIFFNRFLVQKFFSWLF